MYEIFILQIQFAETQQAQFMVQVLDLSVIDEIGKLCVFSKHEELKEVTLSDKVSLNTKRDKAGDFLLQEEIFVEEDPGEIVLKFVFEDFLVLLKVLLSSFDQQDQKYVAQLSWT